MKGKYRVIVQNRRIRYDFEVKRNITILRGDSATGKTVLIEMVREFYENGTDSGVELTCEKRCAVLSGRSWEMQLSVIKNSIVFIDEGNHFVASKEFAAAIQKTDNYYVIVTREGLPALPYSVDEIYGIRNSGKYGSLKQVYQEFYHLYGMEDHHRVVAPELVITEDSNSGFQFFCGVCESGQCSCVSAGGKSNIFAAILNHKNSEILVVADGAAFGSEMEKVMKLLEAFDNIHLYLPESFEWLILKSGLLEQGDISAVLEEPYNYVESSEDFSWERFFTRLLIEKTSGTYLKYTKRILNPVYLQDKPRKKILQEMKGIEI